MNTNLLKATMALKAVTVKMLCEGIDMPESTFYKKLRGMSEFTKPEIEAIANFLELGRKGTMDIFFPGLVA